MNQKLDYSNVDSTATAIRGLKAAIVEAENQIADCLKHLTLERETLVSLTNRSKDKGKGEYIKAAGKACRLGIKACKLSIAAFEGDIEGYRFELAEILARTRKVNDDQ